MTATPKPTEAKIHIEAPGVAEGTEGHEDHLEPNRGGVIAIDLNSITSAFAMTVIVSMIAICFAFIGFASQANLIASKPCGCHSTKKTQPQPDPVPRHL
jgi:hypothetical protein